MSRDYTPEAVIAELREILRMEYPSVKYSKEVANKAIICIEGLQAKLVKHKEPSPGKEINPEVTDFLAELEGTPVDGDIDAMVSKGMNLGKKSWLKQILTAGFGQRELKDLALSLGRHTGDVDDRSTKGGKGEPDPRIRVMIQEHGFCPHCKEEVTLPGILDVGNFPDDAEEKGYFMNWMRTKHRANFEKV